MKGRAKRFLQTLIVNDFSYKLLSPFIFMSERLKASRNNHLHRDQDAQHHESAKKIFASEQVLHGPFQGLQFTLAVNSASSTYAKLLGSYEAEVHSFILQAPHQQYDKIINIGCDDGYYALGLAKLMPSVPVTAYESNPAALKIAAALAQKNGLAKQVTFEGTFTASNLKQIKEKERIFFLVDIEGEEKTIFNDANVLKLRRSDLLIELHLHIYPEIETYLRSLFGETHDIIVVNSIPDHIKAQQYTYPELADASYGLKKFITQEREMFMQWMWLSAKMTSN